MRIIKLHIWPTFSFHSFGGCCFGLFPTYQVFFAHRSLTRNKDWRTGMKLVWS